MKFSIIIPTFNSEKFIHDCLLSIFQQDFSLSLFEVILVDDCSTDSTVSIAGYFSDRFSNMKIVALDYNGGPGIARNSGLDIANGEWILFVDSDDELFLNCLSSLNSFINRHAEVDAVAYDWKLQQVDHTLKSSKRSGRRDSSFLNGEKSELIKQYLSHRMDGSVIYTAVRKKLLNLWGIRFSSGYHEDVDFIFKIYYYAKSIAYLDKVLYKKRNHVSSIMNAISETHIDGYFRAWKSIGKFVANLTRTEEVEDVDFRRKYYKAYQYGTIGAIATRVREVVRHSRNLDEIEILFSRIYCHVQKIFTKEVSEEQLAKDDTVYFQIVKMFCQIMALQDISGHQKATMIVSGVKKMSGKSWSCEDLHHSLFLRPDQVRTCCKRFFVDGEMRGDVVLFDVTNYSSQAITSQQVLNAKRDLHQKINSGQSTPCDGCPFLEFREWSPLNELEIKYLSLEYHSICNLRCTYCSDDYFGGKQASYDIQSTINGLLSHGNLDNCNIIVWGGGEPTLEQNFESLLSQLSEQLPNVQQRVLTNSVKWSAILHALLADHKAQIVTSLDAGTNKTFQEIRGKSKLEIVCKNLKQYAEANSLRVTIKYIFTEGNQAVDEVRNFVNLVHKSGLTQCNFQISSDFKHETITESSAISMILMFGLLQKVGVKAVYFDELLRHRLSYVIDVSNSNQIENIHKMAGFNFIATPVRYPQVVVWGAGQQAKYMIKKTSFFRFSEVVFWVDDTPQKIGTKFLNKEIYSPEVLHECNFPVLIAAVQGYPLILERFQNLGIDETRLVRELIL